MLAPVATDSPGWQVRKQTHELKENSRPGAWVPKNNPLGYFGGQCNGISCGCFAPMTQERTAGKDPVGLKATTSHGAATALACKLCNDMSPPLRQARAVSVLITSLPN